ncbi:MAG: LysR substrate-binding domain-containing protein [Hyphomicrobiales bacterium]
MPLTLPPLNALRAFEAAARTGSYVAAARELGVTAAAVSQQVRKLEDFIGKELFRRFNNRVTLTDAGQTIFVQASEAIAQIRAIARPAAEEPVRSRLVLSVLPSVAHRWFEPRLARIAQQLQSIRFELRVEEDPVDFSRHEIDLRLCYGTNLYPDQTVIPLRHDEVLPMASPRYLERNPMALAAHLAGVPDDDLIHTDWGPSFGSHPRWADWFAEVGVARASAAGGYRIGMSTLALDLARDGVGVVLGQRMLAEEDLATGRLLILSPAALPMGHAYSLIHPPAKRRKAGLADLIQGLLAA